MSKKKEISLLPEESNNNSLSSRIIQYITTVGKYIIIFTELIVISAFISRFWLDRQNSDISETLRQQKAIIESTTDFEKEYTSLQSRLKYIDTQYKNQPNYISNIQSLVTSIPSDVYLEVLTVNPDSAQMSIYSFKEDSLINLIVNLSLNPQINNVNIQNIQKKSKDSKYLVEILLKFNPKSAQSAI